MKKYSMYTSALGISVLFVAFLAALTARAELIAYDQFDEYADGESLSATNSGYGFSGAWTASEADTSGLSYPSLPVAGGSGTTGSATAQYKGSARNLAAPLTSGTYYFGFLMNKGAGSPNQFRVFLKNSANDKHISAGIWDGASDWRLIRQDGAGSWGSLGTGVSVDSSTAYCVLKLDLGAGAEVARLFVNPASVGDLIDGSEDAKYTFNSGMGELSILQFNRKHSGGVAVDQVWVDEIRIGTAAADMFSSLVPDEDPPTAGPLTPTNGAVDVTLSSDFTISFSEEVQAGTGSILVKETDGDAIHESILISDSGRVIFDTTNVTINIDTDLSLNTGYYILITNGVIEDLSGNSFAGLTNTTDWAFTTISGLTAPGATTAGGATSLAPSTASLRAELTNGVVADVYICWGAVAGDTVSTASWANVVSMGSLSDGEVVTNAVSGLYYGVEYSYVVYATNGVDSAWSSVTNFATLPPSTWTPADLTTEAWYDAADSDTVQTSDGSAVTNWVDKSRNGNHAIQGTSSKQPVSGGNINGRNAIAFDPTASVRYLTTGLAQLTDVSMYIVLDATSRGNAYINGVIGACNEEWTDNGFGWPLENYGDGTARNGVTYQPGDPNGLLSVYCNGVLGGSDHNFQPALLSHQGTGLTTLGLSYHIGHGRQGTGWAGAAYKGSIGEIVICPVEHDAPTRQKVEGYLAHKWGLVGNLPVGHPYETDGPTGGAALIGINNSFSTNETTSTADLLGSLDATQSIFTVRGYWSTSNNISDAEWLADTTASNAVFGIYTNVTGQSLSNTVSSLESGTTYYFTYMASNAVTNIWADGNVTFSTLANELAPSVDNNGGAAPVLSFSATLKGNMSVGGQATAYVVYGTSEPTSPDDENTNAWDQVVTLGLIQNGTFSTNITGLSQDQQYFYRCFVTNSAGGAWSVTTNFTTDPDLDPPIPSTMVFEVLPYAASTNSIAMVATPATDPSTPVEYRFTNTTENTVSDWSTSRTWTNSGLSQSTTYGYRVQARDALSNETAWSDVAEAIIDPPGYIYEPFAYSAGDVNGSQNGGIGMAGGWSTSGSADLYDIVSPGLSFSALTTSGGMPRRPWKSGYAELNREISMLNKTALVGDNTTIWFSILMRDAAYWADYAYDAFLFASDPISGTDGSRRVIITSGQGLGVSFNFSNVGGTQYMNVHGIITDNGTTTVSTGSIPDASPGVKDQTTYLIAGQITWAGNGTNDTLRLFNILDPLALQPMDNEAFATMTADLDQSLFDTLTMGTADMAKLDEIRFAPSFNEVMGREADTTAPTKTALVPANNGVNIPVNTHLTITFDDNMKAGSGSILVKASGGTTVATLDAASPSITYGGTNVIIDLPSNLNGSTSYYVLITNGVMQDLAGNAFSGIANASEWAFATLSPDETPPSPSTMTFDVAPTALDEVTVSMTATTATDDTLPIQYFFTNTVNGDVSGWISETTWVNASLPPAQTYKYRVKAKDALGNETLWSDEASVTLTLEPGGYIYEPFDYSVGNINGKDGGSGFATAGWTATTAGASPIPYTVISSGLSLTNLPTAGRACARTANYGEAEMHREINEGNKVALLNDNDDIWFSLLFENNAYWSGYENLSVVLSTGAFDASGAKPPTMSGEGIGVGFNQLGAIHAVVIDDSGSRYSPDALTVAYGTTNFIVGRITWAPSGANDTVRLYHLEDAHNWRPVYGAAFATVSADLDQSQFSTIAIASREITTVDEIRFGTTLRDVLGIDAPVASLFLFR